MTMPENQIDVVCVSNNGDGASEFTNRTVNLNGDSQRMISDQIPALNFRLRKSDRRYSSTWHVAGDPTLLLVLSGTIRIELRNGESRDFSSRDMFIAQDYLHDRVEFDDAQHGHRAEVVGDDAISVLHLKLDKR